MKTFIKFFLDNHKLTLILSIMMVVFGLMGMFKLNAESYPSVNFAMVTVETRYDGATAKDIETQITKPIEDKIREVSGLKDVRSISKSGFSKIFVRVDMDNEDEDKVIEDLQKAVDSVSNLPPDLREDPSFKEINSEEFPAVELAIIGENTNRGRDLMVDLLKEELEDNKRVLNVRPVGWRKRQYNIRLNEKLMDQYHIGLEEITSKIRQRNVDVPGGNLKSNGQKTLIRVEGKVKNVSELENVVIRSNFSGQKVLLKDIAIVEDGEEDAQVLASYNAKPAAFLVVNKKAGADTLALVHDIDTIVAKFRKQYEGQYEISIYNNEADKVKNKLSILSSNAISGLILVVIFLFLFLPGKIGLMASLSLPLAVMATIGFMPIFGMNLDAITILALVIALGMMVDNAVVISENFARLKNDEGLSSYDAALKSVKQLWLPITATAFTTIASFLPMLVTKGIMGQFIKYIPIVVTIALLISLSESFFLLPMRLRFFGGDTKKINEEVQADWFHKFIVKFEKLMDWSIRNRYKMFVMFGGVLIGSFLLMTLGNKFMLFPPEQTEIYLGRVEMPRGTTVEETRKELNRISAELRTELGDWTKWITARAGISNMGPTDPKGATGENHGLIIVYASDYAKYNIKYDIFLEKMKKVTSTKVKKLKFEEMVNGPPVGAPINATFRSNNVENLDAMINEIIAELSKVEGIYDLETDDILGEKEVKVLINYDKADQLGLSVSSIGEAIKTALNGNMVSKIILDNKEVDLNVRYQEDYRIKPENIESIKVMDRQGNLVPVKTIASTEMTNGSYEIKRFDFKKSKTLLGKVKGEMTSMVANQKLKAIYDKLHLKYNDVSLVFGGEEENTKESMESLGQALILALMGIFGLLVFLFGSYLRPMIIMSTIPLGLVGFSIAFFFHDKAISFLAMIGVIGLAGIIVNSGIVLISFIDDMKKEGKMELHDILVKASGMRLRAVLVTSLTTISGLIPTAYGIGGSDAMLVPMTMAMAWGLTSGTILTLVWVPCAYAILEDWSAWLSKKPFLNKFVGGNFEESNTSNTSQEANTEGELA
jgi:multidrug efflux pump subunit AcrB